MENDIKNITEIVKKVLGLLEKFFRFCFKSFEKAEIQFDFGQAFFFIVLFILLFGSGCVSYSIARSRHRKPWGFFILGCLIPVLTPLLMMFLLSTEFEILDERSRKQKMLADAAEKNTILGQKKQQEEEARLAEEAARSACPWNAKYFSGIYRHADGTAAGPWNVTYGGATVIVGEIQEILDEVLVVTMVTAAGDRIKMRIPFAKIEKWEERTEPLPGA